MYDNIITRFTVASERKKPRKSLGQFSYRIERRRGFVRVITHAVLLFLQTYS